MDVFLVPVAPDRYELYCEEPDTPPAPSLPGHSRPGFVRRSIDRFREMLAQAERDHRHGPPAASATPLRLSERVKARMMRWVAESVAEQRLLWQLRGRDHVQLLYPANLTEPQGRQLLVRKLGRDFERHRFWLVLDCLGLLATAVLAILPGPNLIAYYFIFRIVGHFLSMRGARQGLSRIQWTVDSSAPLATLRRLAREPSDLRAAQVREVASALGLEHFASFFERTSTP